MEIPEEWLLVDPEPAGREQPEFSYKDILQIQIEDEEKRRGFYH